MPFDSLIAAIAIGRWMLHRPVDARDVAPDRGAAWSCDRDRPTYLIKSDGKQKIIKNHDRGAIVAWSRRDQGLICAAIMAPLRQNQSKNHHQLMGHDRRAIVAIKPLPQPDQMALKIGQKFPLKRRGNLLCSSTFDWFVKQLRRFGAKSSVLRDPPALRLNCEAIRAGLITNSSLISSNFPLDFRTSARKKSSKFASIHVNWSPILTAIGLAVRFDQLSRGSLSFY